MGEEATLYERLAKAQAEMRNPELDKVNPHFKNRFASLAAVRNAVIPALSKYGLCCVQGVMDGRVWTTVFSPDGNTLSMPGLPVKLEGNPQGNGSELTYAKRYSLQLAFCLVGDDDDDAEEAERSSQNQQHQKQQQRQPSPLTDAQKAFGANLVASLASAAGWDQKRARDELFRAVGKPPSDSQLFDAWAAAAEQAVMRMSVENSPAWVAGQEAANV